MLDYFKNSIKTKGRITDRSLNGFSRGVSRIFQDERGGGGVQSGVGVIVIFCLYNTAPKYYSVKCWPT